MSWRAGRGEGGSGEGDLGRGIQGGMSGQAAQQGCEGPLAAHLRALSSHGEPEGQHRVSDLEKGDEDGGGPAKSWTAVLL